MVNSFTDKPPHTYTHTAKLEEKMRSQKEGEVYMMPKASRKAIKKKKKEKQQTNKH